MDLLSYSVHRYTSCMFSMLLVGISVKALPSQKGDF